MIAACGSCNCDDQPRPILNLIRGIPLNLEIPLRVLSESETAPWLELTDGTNVPATVQRRTGANVWWLKVDEDLKPNTDYFIARDTGREAGFTTGNARDEEPPTLEGISVEGGGNEALCSNSVGGILQRVSWDRSNRSRSERDEKNLVGPLVIGTALHEQDQVCDDRTNWSLLRYGHDA
ncbi:MAG TPA: hypothetical protein VJN18_20765 [Polyangiaceae bacterium]|nr:hypothetical protein [Polyangiaceae bacterium]